MPISIDIQNKVLKVAANKAVDSNVRLAVRKQFYVLKSEEIDLEAVQEEFNKKIVQFGLALDKLLQESSATSLVVEPVEVPKKNQEEIIEEIIVPKKGQQEVSGVKVRMQEELDGTEEDTDFEVPFEVDEN
jgi:hypothetical protein